MPHPGSLPRASGAKARPSSPAATGPAALNERSENTLLQVPSLHAVQRLPVSAIAPVERKWAFFADRDEDQRCRCVKACRTKAPQL